MRPAVSVTRSAWRRGELADGERLIPEEVVVTLSYDGCARASTTATPQDLEDLALGFSLTEGIASTVEDIRGFEIVEGEIGIQLRISMSDRRGIRYRYPTDPTGFGRGGIDSLDEALVAPRRVRDGQLFTPGEIMRALEALANGQEINRQTRAVHAAAFWQPGSGLITLREDVGRHNALDKLGGAMARQGIPLRGGMALLTSRISARMVQKAAMLDVPLLIGGLAPTALAVRMAQAADITLIAIARGDGFEIFTHPKRVAKERIVHVA